MSFLAFVAASIEEVAVVARKVDRAVLTIASALEGRQPRQYTAPAVVDERLYSYSSYEDAYDCSDSWDDHERLCVCGHSDCETPYTCLLLHSAGRCDCIEDEIPAGDLLVDDWV
jgi:hypothetical protein